MFNFLVFDSIIECCYLNEFMRAHYIHTSSISFSSIMASSFLRFSDLPCESLSFLWSLFAKFSLGIAMQRVFIIAACEFE